MLSYKFWKAHYHEDPRVVGDTIRLNNNVVTIVGVTPPEFHGVNPVLDVWRALPPRNFPNYASGTWGPKEADELLERDGRRWRNFEK